MNKVTLRQWGNSAGITIPHHLLEETGSYVGENFTICVRKKGAFILSPIRDPQADWKEAFDKIADNENEQLLGNLSNAFDEDEWTW